jgi:Barrel-sandwich domain of CusB or HlyD membrane-fusion
LKGRVKVASQPAPEPITLSIPQQIPRAASPESATLAALLQFEAEVRRQPTEAELVYHVANESRRILPYDQMFVLRRARIGEGHHVIAASSIAVVDRNAPLIAFIEATISRLRSSRAKSRDLVGESVSTGQRPACPERLPWQAVEGLDTNGSGLDEAQSFDATAYALTSDDALDDYPFHAWHWHPMRDAEGDVFAGLLVARTEPLREGEAFRLTRIAETVEHGWRALAGGKPVKPIKKLGKRERRGIAVALLGIALLPVRMTALAPVEVVAARPFVITAPFAGVVQRIEIPPNTQVRKGQLLVQFDDTKMRNELGIAAEKLAVARARVERSSTAAFGVAEEAREISITRAEYDLAQAEHAYATDMMTKSRIVAPRDGMAIYTDRREWEGRAVNTGEAIMQVADPREVSLRIDLPAHEQMALETGAPVKIWLDSQPLWSLDAKLDRASFQARMTPENVLAFALTAKPLAATPRIGSRGTARVYGRWVPFAYSMLKRPISSARQYLGY